MSVAIVILAAGKGTRMKSDLPKVLHPVAGAPLLIHVMKCARDFGATRIIVVTGHGATQVAETAREFDPDVRIVEQAEQLGTAHAVLQARPELSDFEGDVIVVYGDVPLIQRENLTEMHQLRLNGIDLGVLGFEASDPTGYGRLIIDADGTLNAIIEEKDASPEERRISICNSGVVIADCGQLFSMLDNIGNDNAKGEYYLTDLAQIARGRGYKTATASCDEADTLGVNSRADLAVAEAAFQMRARAEALENGVTMTDPSSVWFAHDTCIGRDVTIGPNVFFGPDVTIESGATIHAFCHLEGCHVSNGAIIGPFARLRPGAELSENVRVGNFVEIKNATLAEGAKVNHLSYIGDATVGAHANIGAGTITCNYDGVFKHRTNIGAHAFIGSNSALVAPVDINDNALIAAGSTITEDVGAGDLALGRAQQTNKPGLGKRLMERLRSIKSGSARH